MLLDNEHKTEQKETAQPIDELAYDDKKTRDKSKAVATTADKKIAGRKTKAKKAQASLPDQHKEKKPASKKTTAAVFTLVIIVFTFIVGLSNVERIEAARAIIGSTVLPDIITDGVVSTPTVPDESDTPIINSNGGYNYIVPAELNAKTATEVAAWYIIQFEANDSNVVNEQALAEFEAWYKERSMREIDFNANYKDAYEYLTAHPEVFNPTSNAEPTVTPSVSPEEEETFSDEMDVPKETETPEKTSKETA